MRINLQPAYCMHTRRFRESSQIIDVLTSSHGLISCVRRGSIKNNASSDYLFTPLLISWSGKGDLYALTHIEIVGSKQIVLPDKCILGMYLNELVLKLIPKLSPSKEVFNLYKNIISLLNDDAHHEKLLRLFEVELLSIIGHGLSLDKEVDHETPIKEDCIYRYDVGIGPAKVMHKSSAWNIVEGATLLSLQSPLHMDSSCLKEAKRLMRGIINCHLDSRPLHSREILQFMQA